MAFGFDFGNERDSLILHMVKKVCLEVFYAFL